MIANSTAKSHRVRKNSRSREAFEKDKMARNAKRPKQRWVTNESRGIGVVGSSGHWERVTS